MYNLNQNTRLKNAQFCLERTQVGIRILMSRSKLTKEEHQKLLELEQDEAMQEADIRAIKHEKLVQKFKHLNGR